MSSFSKQSVDADSAVAAVEAARKKAAELGIPVSIVVLDESGRQKAALRMDGAATGTMEVAFEKANAIVFLGMPAPTEHLFEAIKDSPAGLHAIAGREGITLLGGGAPIVVDGQLTGTVGVSGGRESDDQEIVGAAIAATA